MPKIGEGLAVNDCHWRHQPRADIVHINQKYRGLTCRLPTNRGPANNSLAFRTHFRTDRVRRHKLISVLVEFRNSGTSIFPRFVLLWYVIWRARCSSLASPISLLLSAPFWPHAECISWGCFIRDSILAMSGCGWLLLSYMIWKVVFKIIKPLISSISHFCADVRLATNPGLI